MWVCQDVGPSSFVSSVPLPSGAGDKLGLTLCSAEGGRETPNRRPEPVTQFCRALWTLRNLTLTSKRPGPLADCGAGRGLAGLKVQTRGPWEVRGRRTEDARTGPVGCGRRGQSVDAPQGPPGLRGSLRGDAPGQGAAARAETPAIRGASGRSESRAETGSWRGFRETAAQRRRRPVPSHSPPPPRDPRSPPSPAGPRYLGSVASPLPSGCQPRAHPLQPDSADAPPRHPGSALATRCELLLALSAGTSGAGQRLAEGE